MTQVDAFLEELRPRWQHAYQALCNGDVEPWAAIWSTRDPVSLFGAAGSASGHEEVRRVQSWVAGRFAGLVDEKQELVAAGASGDLAYTVAFEHKTVYAEGGGEPVTYTLRTTHVFRREDGEWRIVHRHGDFPPSREDFPVTSGPDTV
ncbi:nuclear transport factor 2 family protein [Pseudonocardia sp. C8]|uniref:YybH family protein n=1 Tax=Pseudonocardia sp. C8 TaxID=2762759 RepID=UPI00164282F7|nr:nuclear transport factor 2 family protein [Pseudonocardia sp. C8]MBC3194168.1 nuclear transport factor 2 family protein [Pseudonocardia sp. C8]